MLELILAATAASTALIAKGEEVTYTTGGVPQCARVTYVDTGADGRPWAWIVGGRPPQWVLHVPMQELARGCEEDARARQ